MKPFKSATMCSGIGSPEQSLFELGIPHENVFACEKDKFARQTYLANFSPGTMYEDTTTEAWDLPEQYADLIVAGIPCQSFSLAGKRKGENDPRGLLIYDFIRYVKNQRPKVFIIENVKGLLSDAGGVTFSKWCELLGYNKNGQSGLFTNSESCGYNLHYRVLNAKHYGLPQNRERVFIIGIRPDLVDTFRWPKRVVLKDRLINLLESYVDEKYYLSDTALKYIVKDSGNWSDRLSMMDSSNAMVSGSITANHSKGVPYNMLQLVGSKSSGFDTTGRIYSAGGISPAIPSVSGGGYNSPLVRLSGFKESENAIRGVKSDGSGLQEMFYNKENGISGTISKSHKPKVIQLNPSKESGGVQPCQQNRVYDSLGISPAIDDKAGIYGIAMRGRNPDNPKSRKPGEHAEQMIEINENPDISNVVTSVQKDNLILDNYRIRRYTPLECMRLMGYPDTFIKPCSETQTYKQAGNSIPVHMMKAILKQLLPILTS